MGTINIGDAIRIPCEVKPGPFSEEKLIAFDTLDGVVSGFVDERDILEHGGSHCILGLVKEITSEQIVVMVRGSFFQTNGIATVARSIACAA